MEAAALQKTAGKLSSDSRGSGSADVRQQGLAFARLTHLLQLYFLADPENADTDLPADLEGIATDAWLAPAGEHISTFEHCQCCQSRQVVACAGWGGADAATSTCTV